MKSGAPVGIRPPGQYCALNAALAPGGQLQPAGIAFGAALHTSPVHCMPFGTGFTAEFGGFGNSPALASAWKPHASWRPIS